MYTEKAIHRTKNSIGPAAGAKVTGIAKCGHWTYMAVHHHRWGWEFGVRFRQVNGKLICQPMTKGTYKRFTREIGQLF